MPRIRDSQIMFRVYDERVGEMVGSHFHVFGESFAFGRVESWIKNHREAKGDETIVERINDMVLTQYTGLRDATEWGELTDEEKDKWYNREKDWEGKYIWEGDVVETSKGWIEIVKWNGKRAGFQPFSIPPSCYLEETKVLGNKFQNPELLGDK